MQKESFDNLMLVGRAGSGKSELIDFLRHVPAAERQKKYNIGEFEEIDDFPWIHSYFRDEDIWEELGYPRRFSKRDKKIYTTVDYTIYDFTTMKFNQQIKKLVEKEDDFYGNRTLFVEYARGGHHGIGYKKTLGYFEDSILKRTAVFYVDNTFEESMRRNTVRSSEDDEKQTILHHKCPVEVMENYYKTHDWYELTDKQPDGYIDVRGIRVPFVTVWNVPESHDFKVLEERYSTPLKKLWELYSNRRET